MKELKTGDLVWVSDYSEENARRPERICEVYLYTDKAGKFVTQPEERWKKLDSKTTKWNYAIPVPKTETRVKRASEIMRILEDEGYCADSDGHWTSPRINKRTWNRGMWITCGKTPAKTWRYEPEWLEEVEVE